MDIASSPSHSESLTSPERETKTCDTKMSKPDAVPVTKSTNPVVALSPLPTAAETPPPLPPPHPNQRLLEVDKAPAVKPASSQPLPKPAAAVLQLPNLSIHVNKRKCASGDLGPFLDPKKIEDLPDKFGPGPINRVVRQSVQQLVDAAFEQKEVSCCIYCFYQYNRRVP